MQDQEFIIGGSPVLLRALHEAFRDDPEVSVLSTSGEPAAPQRLVVTMSPGRAASLSDALGAAVVIEGNERLQPP